MLVFIDYSKAFDFVDHKTLWKTMHDISGFPDHITLLLKFLYDIQMAIVRIENSYSDCFQMGKGVRQGCIISLYLFNLYGERIMRSALDTNIGRISIGVETVKDLRYADDTTAISETVRDMKHMIEKIRLESDKIGLYLNVDKTKMMVIGGNNEQLYVNGRVVEKVILIFLGLTSQKRAVQRRKSIVEFQWQSLQLFHSHKSGKIEV